MNLYLKNTTLLFCIILIISMWDCKKDNPKTLTINHIVKRDTLVFHEFRDSLVGTYNCIESYYSWWVPNNSYDSIIGPASVTVAKASDDSSIIINGNTYSYSYYYRSDSSQTVFNAHNLVGYPEFAFLIKQNDSIWFETNVFHSPGSGSGNYYTGRKQ